MSDYKDALLELRIAATPESQKRDAARMLKRLAVNTGDEEGLQEVLRMVGVE